MRPVLNDIVRQSSNLFDIIKIVGSENETKISALDGAKTLFLQAKLKEAVPEFIGEFGISNFSLLNGLLNFASYKTDDSKFSVKREIKKPANEETVTEFKFRDGNSAGSSFKTTASHMIPEQALISNIPWDVVFEPSRAKIAEFSQLAGLYSEVTKNFGVQTVDTSLIFTLGDENASTHNANMVFAENVTGELKGTFLFNTQQFLSVVKLAGTAPTMVKLTSRGILSLSITTEFGEYNYFLRAHR